MYVKSLSSAHTLWIIGNLGENNVHCSLFIYLCLNISLLNVVVSKYKYFNSVNAIDILSSLQVLRKYSPEEPLLIKLQINY